MFFVYTIGLVVYVLSVFDKKMADEGDALTLFATAIKSRIKIKKSKKRGKWTVPILRCRTIIFLYL